MMNVKIIEKLIEGIDDHEKVKRSISNKDHQNLDKAYEKALYHTYRYYLGHRGRFDSYLLYEVGLSDIGYMPTRKEIATEIELDTDIEILKKVFPKSLISKISRIRKDHKLNQEKPDIAMNEFSLALFAEYIKSKGKISGKDALIYLDKAKILRLDNNDISINLKFMKLIWDNSTKSLELAKFISENLENINYIDGRDKDYQFIRDHSIFPFVKLDRQMLQNKDIDIYAEEISFENNLFYSRDSFNIFRPEILSSTMTIHTGKKHKRETGYNINVLISMYSSLSGLLYHKDYNNHYIQKALDYIENVLIDQSLVVGSSIEHISEVHESIYIGSKNLTNLLEKMKIKRDKELKNDTNRN